MSPAPGGAGLVLALLLLALPLLVAAEPWAGRLVRAVQPSAATLEGGDRVALEGLVLGSGTPVGPPFVSPGDRLEAAGGRLVLRAHPLRGTFLDTRYGELLLGRPNLLLPEWADVRLNGLPARREDLPTGRAALVRWDPATGQAGRLEVVDPSRRRPPAPGPGDLWAVRAGLSPGAGEPARALRAGETLHLEVKASAGGRATVDVAGVAWGLPTREVAPGVYRGALRVVPGLDLRDTFVLGHFRRRGRDFPPRVGPSVSLAPTPPLLEERGPVGGALAESPVFARYRSPGARIDASRVRLEVDGVDVTAGARRTVEVLFYAPPRGLARGPHRVRLAVPDTAGNLTRAEWGFVVD